MGGKASPVASWILIPIFGHSSTGMESRVEWCPVPALLVACNTVENLQAASVLLRERDQYFLPHVRVGKRAVYVPLLERVPH